MLKPQSWLNAWYLLLQSCFAAAFFFFLPAASALAFAISDRSRESVTTGAGGLAGGCDLVSGRGTGASTSCNWEESDKKKKEMLLHLKCHLIY